MKAILAPSGDQSVTMSYPANVVSLTLPDPLPRIFRMSVGASAAPDRFAQAILAPFGNHEAKLSPRLGMPVRFFLSEPSESITQRSPSRGKATLVPFGVHVACHSETVAAWVSCILSELSVPTLILAE